MKIVSFPTLWRISFIERLRIRHCIQHDGLHRPPRDVNGNWILSPEAILELIPKSLITLAPIRMRRENSISSLAYHCLQNRGTGYLPHPDLRVVMQFYAGGLLHWNRCKGRTIHGKSLGAALTGRGSDRSSRGLHASCHSPPSIPLSSGPSLGPMSMRSSHLRE